MDARRPSPPRRRPRRGLTTTLALALALVATTLVAPTEAYAAARSASLASGAGISIRSGDGCTVKLAPPANGRKFARNFVCQFVGTVKPPPAQPPAPRIQALFNGDTMAVTSADGCVLKPIPKNSKYVKNVGCFGSGTTPPPTGGTGQPPPAVTGGATWRTVFADEFTGAAVDRNKWNVADNSNFGSGNNEDQCYKAANTTVGGGTLKMAGRRQTVSGCGTNPDGGGSYYFTSGMVTTRAQGGGVTMKFRQGYSEVRMRVPRGNIYWPAFWLVGAGDGSSPGWPAYGEVDVTEIYGSRPDVSESNFHRTGGNIGAANHNVNTPGSSSTGRNVNPPNAFVAGGVNSFHTYGVNWTASKLEWFIDGVKVRTYNASSNNDLTALAYEHSIILNLAMGGNGPKSGDHGYTGGEGGGAYSNGNLAADLPGTMEIDYVRVFQK
jgi:beta-glucanase (GH16 family)